MEKKGKTVQRSFIALFLFIIFAVPVSQAIVEKLRGGRIQALDLAYDVFIAPLQRSARVHESALALGAIVDSIGKASGPVEALRLVDAAMVATAEFKRNVTTINRHVTLSPAPSLGRPLDSLSSALSALGRQIRSNGLDGAAAERADRLAPLTESLVVAHRPPAIIPGPLLIIKNLRYIFWNDRYLRPYEKEMENSSIYATALRPRMQYAFFRLFGDLGEKGYNARNGWFFYKSDIDFLIKPSVLDPRSIVVDPNDKPVTDDPVAVIKKFKEQLAQRGIDLLVVIIPGKPSMYPDLISKRMGPEQAGIFTHTLHFLDTLKKSGIECVDLFSAFRQERARDREAGDSLYLRRDTHWKLRGLTCAARTVAQRIRQYPWYEAGPTEYALDTVVIDRTGDVGVMSTLPSLKIHGRRFSFPVEKTECRRVFEVLRDESGAEAGRRPYKDDYRNSRVLLLGDSFSRMYQTDEPRAAGWIAHLAFELRQPVASIVSDGGASTLVRQTLARKAGVLKGKKLVVWEFVERDIRFGAEGWKDVDL